MTKVLVVDDHPLVIEGIESLIHSKHKDWVVTKITEYAKAENVTDLKMYDIALIDVRIGEHSGLSLAQKYKKRYKDLRILMITSFADQKALSKSKEIGVDGYLLKTTEINDLDKVILKILNGETSFPQPKIGSNQYNLIIQNQAIQSLSKKQRMILNLLSDGLTNKEISEEMYISEKTVKNYLTTIYKKIDCKSRSEAIAFINRFYGLQIKYSNKANW